MVRERGLTLQGAEVVDGTMSARGRIEIPMVEGTYLAMAETAPATGADLRYAAVPVAASQERRRRQLGLAHFQPPPLSA